MVKLAELVGHELKWIQPHALKMEYELHAGEMIAATLRFRSSLGSFATATSADGTWTFKRVGFWQTKVTIRAAESETDLATFRNNTWSGGGTLELLDGRKYPANTNFWSTQYEFKTEQGESLISYRKIGGILHMSSVTEIHPLARNIPEMPWMVLLGWYLTVMMHMDSAAAAAA
ncbi:MAG: hypothetical protein HYZ25_18700 [Chloroflexi bacterium]|nr:hypothetical protein [Chloroflexota bacterium]